MCFVIPNWRGRWNQYLQSGLAGGVWKFHPCDCQLLSVLSFSLYPPFPWWWQMGAQRNREEQSEVLLSSSHLNFEQNTERTGTKEGRLFFSSTCSLLSFTAQQVSYFEREKGTKISTHFSNSLISLFSFPFLYFPLVLSFPILPFVRQNGGRWGKMAEG